MRDRATFPYLLAGLTALALLAACGGAPEEAAAPAPTETAAPAAAPAAAGPTGTATIAGTITYEGQVPTLRPLDMNADPNCAAKHDSPVMPDMLVLGEGNTMGNIFVQVKNAPGGTYPAPAAAVVIDQNGCRYEPHVAGVLVGQALEFKNSDGLLHNVHGLPQVNPSFNVAMPGSRTETDIELNQPEPLFPVKCDVHPWMQAFVAVMSHPFFDVTGTDGGFTIANLPAGTYEIEAWHERLGTQTTEVTVAEGGTATADFTFTAPN